MPMGERRRSRPSSDDVWAVNRTFLLRQAGMILASLSPRDLANALTHLTKRRTVPLGTMFLVAPTDGRRPEVNTRRDGTS